MSLTIEKSDSCQYPVSGETVTVHAVCFEEACEHEWVAGHVAYVLTVELRPTLGGGPK